MELSKYIHCLEKNGYYILYNVATTKVFLITNRQYQDICNGIKLDSIFDDNQLAVLSKAGCLNDENEFNLKECIIENNHDNVDIFAIYLILTEQCNMNCKYCSQSAYRTRERLQNMTPDTVENVLQKFYQTKTKRKRTVVLYGGEPTLNRRGIETAVNYVRNVKCDSNADITIFSNGLLMDDNLIEFFKDNNVNVILSIDGEQEINDKYRLIGEDGSYNKIMEAARRLKRHSVPFGTSSTIAAHNVSKLKETVRFLYSELSPVSIGLNPFHYAPENRTEMAVDEEEMANRMLEAYEIARTYGLYIEQIMRRVRPYVLATPRFKDCPSCGGMIRVLPDGSFGPCGHFMEEKKEQEKPNYKFEESEVMLKWNSRVNVNVINKCSSCVAMALCGGGCPFNSLKHGGDIFSANDDRSCIQARVFLDWLLEQTVDGLPTDTFYNVNLIDKRKILSKINIEKYIPMVSYSKYGEFSLNERYV